MDLFLDVKNQLCYLWSISLLDNSHWDLNVSSDFILIICLSRVGFNSVYHLTDLPSFVSGKYVVLFDPQGFYLPKVSTANPGKRIDYVSSSAISLYKDQFFPYCAFGCDMKIPFAGTLFRFPLRNVDQAVRSKLSRQAYSEDDISSMFAQLYKEGVFTLLFLKSVMCIEMYVWDVGEPEPRKLYSCSVSSVNNDTVWHRQAVLRLSKSVNSSNSEMDAFSLDFLSEAAIGTQSEKRMDSFYIVQTMASASSRIGSFAATASKEYDIHLLPWASVAACTSDGSSNVICNIQFVVFYCNHLCLSVCLSHTHTHRVTYTTFQFGTLLASCFGPSLNLSQTQNYIL